MKKTHVAGRRNFIKRSISGLAGFAALPTVLVQDSIRSVEEAKPKRVFVYRILGKTGLKLPVINMGVMNADNPNLVRAALEAGIVLLDTAHYYQRGRNEEMIGEVIKGRPRDSFVIATKVLGDGLDRKTGLYTEASTAEPFVKKFEESLKRLGLDYVEILYHHNVVSRGGALFEPYLTAMQRLKKEGKARFLGVTTHRNEPEVIRAAVESKVYDVVLTAYNFRQPHRQEMEKAIAEAAKAGLGIVAMKTQAGVYWDEERQHKINMKAALKWALQNENVHMAIPGFTTFDQMQEDLSVMEDLTLSPQDKKDLQMDMKTGMLGLYCSQCEECLPQCPKNLDIPTYMRSYMYVYGYRNLQAAREALDSVALAGAVPCWSCSTCTVTCAQGFDVKRRVEDVVRLKQVPCEFLG